MVDAPPGDVGDVQEAVDAAEIDEGAVIGDVLDHAGEDLAFLERGDQLRALLGPAFLEHGAARHHDIAARAVHLEDLEGLRRAQQGGDVAHRADIDLAARQKGAGAVEIDGEAALDAAEDDPGDALVALERLLEQGPRLLARQLRLAVLVLHPFEEDLDGVADLDVRLVAGRLAGGGEFLEIDAALGFQSDVDQDRIILDRDYPTLDDGALEAARLPQGLVQQGGEVLFFRFRRFATRCYSHSDSSTPRMLRTALPGVEAASGGPPSYAGAAAWTRSCGSPVAVRRSAYWLDRLACRRGGAKFAGDIIPSRRESAIGVEIGRVEHESVAGRPQRSRPTPAVARVAILHVLQDGPVYSLDPALPQLFHAPAGAFGLACRDEDLGLRVGTDDRPDVAPVQHGARFPLGRRGGEVALELEKRAAHRRNRRHRRGKL